MKKVFILLMPVAALLLTAAGCAAAANDPAAADAAFYRRAAGYLEDNGSFYHIGSNAGLYRSFEEWMSGLRESIAESGNPEPLRMRMQGIAAGVELFCRLSGISDCAGFAASSRRISGNDGKTIYRNRKYFAPVKDAAGFIWEGRNPASPRLEWLGRLPETAVCAFSFDVEPALLLTAADRAGRGRDEADKLARGIFGVSAAELAEGMTGEWRFYMVFDGESKPFPWLMVLELPDRGNRLFDRICTFAGTSGSDGKSASGIVSFGDGGRIAPAKPSFLKVSGGRLAICSSAAAAELHQKCSAGKVPQLKDKSSYRRLAAGMPPVSAGFFYSDFSGTADEVITVANINVGIAPFDAPELEVFEFTPEREWVVTGHSTIDLNTICFSRFVLTPAIMAASKLEALRERETAPKSGPDGSPAEKESGRAEVPEKSAAANPEKCVKVLEDAADRILRYRRENNGKLPAGLDGWLKTNNICCPAGGGSDFVTFGDVPADAPEKWPLVMDRPGNHGDSFVVLYLSGKCGRIELDRQSSVKRMISALHSAHPYEEKVLSELIRRADAADKTLNGSEKK